MSLSKRLVSALLAVMMVLTMFTIIPAAAAEQMTVSAYALYKSHKLEWIGGSSTKVGDYTITKSGGEAVDAKITSVTVGSENYYTAIVEVGTGAAANTTYTVTSTDYTGSATVNEVTGKEALIKNALVSVDYREETNGYKVFDGQTVVDLNVSAAKLAKLKALTGGSIVLSATATTDTADQAIIALTDSVTNESGVFVGTRYKAKKLGIRFSDTWKCIYNTYDISSKSAIGLSVDYKSSFVAAVNGVSNSATNFKNRTDAEFLSKSANEITGVYIGGSKNKNCAFTGNIYYALITEEVYTEEELMTITDIGSVPTLTTGSSINSDTMFSNVDGSTWVFVGGRDVEGPYSDVKGVKNYVSEFEEFTRTTYNMGYADGTNSLTGNPNRERYVINAGKTGNTLALILANYERLVKENDPKAISYMVGKEDYQNADESSIATFKTNLKLLIDKGLALRNGTGYVVIQNPYAPADATLYDGARAYALAVNEVVTALSADDKNRVAVINHFAQTDTNDFRSTSLNADGSLNGVGHLTISKQIESKVVVKEIASWTIPSLEFDGVTNYNTKATVNATMNGTSLTVEVSGVEDTSEWTYNVEIDGSYTVSKTAGNTVVFENLPANKDYKLTVVSKDGKTQLSVKAGTTTDGDVSADAVKFETLTAQQQEIQNKIKGDEPLTWMFMGDSITHGVGMYNYKAYDNLVGLFTKYVREELGRKDDTVINSAVSSATTTSTVKRIEERLNRYSPDIVSIQLGTNDATLTNLISVETYKSNLETLINAIKAKGAIAILRAPIARLDTSSTGGAAQQKYVDACREIAQKHNVLFIDQYTIISEHIAKNRFLADSDRNGYMFFYNNDNLHLTTNGQIAMTRMFLDGIGCNTLNSAIYNNVFKITGSAESNTAKPQVLLNRGSISLAKSAISSVYSTAFSYVTLTATKGDLTYTAKGDSDDLGVALNNLPNGTYNVTTAVRLTGSNKTVTFAAQEVTLNDDITANVSFSLTTESSKILEHKVDTVIGTLGSDFGSVAGDYTYTLNGAENDNALFTIDGTTLKAASELEQNRTYTVSVKAAVNGQEVVKTFTFSTAAKDGLIFSETNIEVTGNNGVSLTDRSYKNDVINLTEGAFIIRFKSTSNNTIQSLISVSNNAVNAEHFHIYIKPDGSIGMESRNGSGTVSFLHSAGLNIANTNTIAVKYNGEQYIVFANGQRIGEYTRNSFIKGISSDLNAITVGAVARNNSASYQFNGTVDFVNCYSVALSDEKLIEMTNSTYVTESTSASVTFDMNGSGGQNIVSNIEKGTTVTVPATDPTREGYNFTGWYVDAQLSAKFNFETVIDADTTIFAGWAEKAKYDVTFNMNGASAENTVTKVVEGTKVTAPATDPTKEGFIFTGWYVNAEATETFNFNTAINAETVIYAGWVQDNGVAVTDDDITVTTGHTVTVTYKLTAPSYIVDTQFNINYDRTVLELIGKDNAVNFPVISNGNLQVNYDADKIYVASTNVSRNDTDLSNFKSGATLCTLTFKVLKDATTKVTLTPEFIGGKNDDGIGKQEVEYVLNGKIATNAKVERNVQIAELTNVNVTFNMNGSDSQNIVKNVEKGTKVTAPATNPTREGFNFTGWYVDAQLSAKFNFNTVINADTIIYAGWEQDSAAVADDDITVKTGDTVTVTYKLTAPNYIVNTQFNINYDRTVLELIGKDNAVNFPVISNGSLQVNYDADKIYVASTNVSQNDADLGNFKSGATLCTLTFKALKDATTKVTFTPNTIGGKNSSGISEQEVEYVINGEIAVNAKIERNVQITNATIIYGDVNNDGEVDCVDATLILQDYAEIIELSADAKKAADVNRDGKVNANDATLVLQKYADIISDFV